MSFLSLIKRLIVYDNNSGEPDFEMYSPNEPKAPKEASAPSPALSAVSADLGDNLSYIKTKFHTSENLDVVIREFNISYGAQEIPAFLVYFDGLANKEIINLSILKPLMLNSFKGAEISVTKKLPEAIHSSLITQTPLEETGDLEKITGEISFGSCAVFVEGVDKAYIADVKGWAQRGIEKPVNESVLTGPHEAFNENLMANLSLIRKILKNPDLIAESAPVGKISKTSCVLVYIKGVTNQSLIDEARRRLSQIDVDYIFSSGELEQLLEEHTFRFMPEILSTERPDRAASMLADGKIAVIVSGSPYALIMPATASDFSEASEDNYIRFPSANFVRIIRMIGLFFSVFLPGLFIAICTFHHELIPTDLLYAIVATREKVPFPIVLELLLMQISFEVIREAGIRMPSPISSTLGIIGALILGQAAVSASIVSPVLIIVVATSGIGSFLTPTVPLTRAFSLCTMVFIILGAVAGFLGLTAGLMVLGFLIASSSSFGVPFLSPVAPNRGISSLASVFVSPIWKKEQRPKYLKAQIPDKQEHISRKWKK